MAVDARIFKNCCKFNNIIVKASSVYIIKSATSQQHKAQSNYVMHSLSPKFGNWNFSHELLVAVITAPTT